MLTTKYLRAATLGAAFIASATAVSAAPVTFEFSPSAAGLAGANFIADKLNVLDFARVELGATTAAGTAFTENGFLQLNNASLNNNTFNPPGNRDSYSLYIQFSATGIQSASSFNASSTGVFTSLDYTLFGAPGSSTFSVASGTPTVTNAGAPVAIATGSLIGGGTSLVVTGVAAANNPNGVSPGASVSETVNKLVPAFFVSPANMQLQLAGAFNNDINLVTVTPDNRAFLLNGGGGDITFTTIATPVPEPLSLAVVGSGLLGLGLLRRRTRV